MDVLIGLFKDIFLIAGIVVMMFVMSWRLALVGLITLPLIAANLVAGLLLAFAFSMLEVSDSLMLAQQARFYPITKTIYELFQLLGTGKYVASALGVWAMMFLTVTIAGVSVLLGKKMGAVFRA